MVKKPLKKNLKNHFLLFLIVLFGAFLRMVFFAGMGTSDDLAYSKYAANIDKDFIKDSVLTLSTRFGIVYTTALSYKLFGINDFSSVIFVLLASIGNIILTYYFGKLLFNEKVGLMASFLLSFFPLEVVYSTRLMTDVPSAFFASLGVYLFLYSELKSKSKFFYLLSGMFIGIGYLIRESALFIGLFFLVYMAYVLFFKRQIKTEHFLVAAGVFLIIAGEIFIFYKLTGNVLFKYTEVQDYLLRAYAGKYSYFGRQILPQGLFHYPYMILTNPLISYFYILVFIAIVYFVYFITAHFVFSRKKEFILILLFWFLPILLYLSFGSASFSQYLPFKAEPRYLSIITIPAILLLAFFLMRKKNPFGRFKVLIIIALLFVSLVSIHLNKDRNVLNNLRELYPYLEKSSYSEIFIDERSLDALDYISGYKNDLNINEYPNDLKNIRSSYIVINNMMLRNLKAVGKVFSNEITAPPKDWVKVNEIGNKDEDKIIIYYIK